MKVDQLNWNGELGWSKSSLSRENIPQLVLVFGSRTLLTNHNWFKELRDQFPISNILSCSTAGEIMGAKVLDDSMHATAIWFERTSIRVAQTSIINRLSSYDSGRYIAEILQAPDLVHILVFSDGQLVNGSELVNGLNHSNKRKVPITGGLAGDGPHFEKTLVGLNEPPVKGKIVAVGFYGNHLKVGHGTYGGWNFFGPEYTITRSQQNTVYELDGQKVLPLYSKYIQSFSDIVTGTPLMFPFLIQVNNETKESLVRAVRSIDEDAGSIEFSVDMPIGTQIRFTKYNFSQLIDGVNFAANHSLQPFESIKPQLAVLISCAARRQVMNRSTEEISVVARKLGHSSTLTGYYGQGSLSPLFSSMNCELHNQSITITTYGEP